MMNRFRLQISKVTFIIDMSILELCMGDWGPMSHEDRRNTNHPAQSKTVVIPLLDIHRTTVHMTIQCCYCAGISGDRVCFYDKSKYFDFSR